MTTDQGRNLLDAVLTPGANNALIHLLQAVPLGRLARAMSGSPTIAEMFTHSPRAQVGVRERSEHAGLVPAQEWNDERDMSIVAMLLEKAARARRRARPGRGRSRAGPRLAHPFNCCSS
jgi:hypothetical protein